MLKSVQKLQSIKMLQKWQKTQKQQNAPKRQNAPKCRNAPKHHNVPKHQMIFINENRKNHHIRIPFQKNNSLVSSTAPPFLLPKKPCRLVIKFLSTHN